MNRIARNQVPRLLALLLIIGLTDRTADAVDFSGQIRPILSDKCFSCHGPDEHSRKAELRLDTREGAFELRDGHAAVVAGNLEDSDLIARITTADPDDVMPPPDSGKSLTADEVELLRQWIAEGAEWEEHWSFVPVKEPAVPELPVNAPTFNPIDAFILQRLQKENLYPAELADRRTLIRRVTFDLTGLPPTPEETEAFVNDSSPDAYEKVVDRLLASSRYGEHMARFWLDVARYGDTHGLHLDNYREMWPYRDWVVNAFNRNLPYDQFLIEQLAGDLLPDPTTDQMVATGFNRCNVSTNEGGSIKEEVYVRNVVDRVVTFGTATMGLTFDCTRCHDHKFDPLSMKDFYSMFAYFNSIDGEPLDGNRKDHAPVIEVPSEEQKKQRGTLKADIAEMEKRLVDPWEELDRQQAQWLVNLKAGFESDAPSTGTIALGDWYTVGPFSDVVRYLKSRKHGPEGRKIDLDEEFETATGEKLKWKRRSDWKDGEVHADLPGDTAANFVYRKIHSQSEQPVTVSLGSDDAIRVFLNGNRILNNDVSRGAAADQEILDLPLQKGANDLLIKIANYGGNAGYYFAIKSEIDAIPEVVYEIAALETEPTDDQQVRIRDYFRNQVSEFAPLIAMKERLAKSREELTEVERQIPITLVWREREEPRESFILKRGEYDLHGDKVERGTPTALPPMKEDLPNNRLGLARWLVDPEHPLTARVAMNRFWQQLFGTGIVKTSEDFGSQGEPPSHPRLLDWLAARFMAEGWDVKSALKQIVTSRTYQQSSRVTPELVKRDPENRLLARGPRFRLDAEMLRDQALFLGDMLLDTMGGPSVKPPQPDGLWFAVGYSGSNTAKFVPDAGREKVHRRTLYTFVKRTAPPPQMSTFDAPSREACSVRRERTNTPMQALLLLNDPQYVEAARALAQRTLAENGSDNDRLSRMFARCVGRTPTSAELSDLKQALSDELDHYRADEAAAEQLVSVGEFPRPHDMEASRLAAWTMTANLLLNLDEVIMKN